MAERTVATRGHEATTPSREETRSAERYIIPPVDIYEDHDGLIVKADLPGVPNEGLDVRVENNLLTIRGKVQHVAPGEPVYSEYGLANFFRQFELNEKVDREKISAELKNGVLTLQLPKAEEAKPRKIEVRLG